MASPARDHVTPLSAIYLVAIGVGSQFSLHIFGYIYMMVGRVVLRISWLWNIFCSVGR